jgi:hypothetical protein
MPFFFKKLKWDEDNATNVHMLLFALCIAPVGTSARLDLALNVLLFQFEHRQSWLYTDDAISVGALVIQRPTAYFCVSSRVFHVEQ